MTTVYAVSSGEYSDYSVRCLYRRREDAEAHVERYNEGGPFEEAYVEEFELHNKLAPIVQVYTLYGRVSADGGLFEERSWDHADDSGGKHPTEVTVGKSQGEWWINATGVNRARTEKAFRDRVAQVRASVLGIA